MGARKVFNPRILNLDDTSALMTCEDCKGTGIIRTDHMIPCETCKGRGLVRVFTEEEPQKETVNHPPHYTMGRFEVVDVLDDWFPHDPHCWNACKYIARHEHKGKPVEDLRKAIWYLERRLAQLEQDHGPADPEIVPSRNTHHHRLDEGRPSPP